MAESTEKELQQVIRELNRYPIEAFEFLQQGLEFTVRRVHGAAPKGLGEISKWLDQVNAEPADIPSLVAAGEMPESLLEIVEEIGGSMEAAARLNRHVTGHDLCLGLRDLALQKWGLLAGMVLRRWRIRTTKDFGRMVFLMVENNLLQKQPTDRIEDFENVYDFDEAFDDGFRIGVGAARQDADA